ncbi:hypothetical protein [Candidatus Ichthyocystis hellenicum]|uniref:hypothetical protein n=1 Tax=Candidatus Ichthyocystis hellenicum TaxID=1561003 RepID=UPI000B88B776|nr:hypothetical protein [Candidatus Ichthyocystis hellenicum]
MESAKFRLNKKLFTTKKSSLVKNINNFSKLSAIDGERVVPSLRELSIRSISGVSNSESVSFLMQLSNDEIFEAALLVNRKIISL